MRIWAIARNTFKETVRNRIMMNILFFGIGLILLSLVVGDWSMYQQVKVIKDIGLASMSVFGLLIAIFIGIRLMVQELEQRTIYVIASKPILRWEILVGKYIGLGITLAMNLIFMTLFFWITLFLVEGSVDFSLISAILLIYIEILLVVAFALFFSMLTSPTISAICTLIIYIVGHLSEFLWEFVRIYPDQGYHWLLKIFYIILPNLEKLNLKLAAVAYIPYPPHALEYGILYGVSYILFILIITIVIFNKKDLK